MDNISTQIFSPAHGSHMKMSLLFVNHSNVKNISIIPVFFTNQFDYCTVKFLVIINKLVEVHKKDSIVGLE